MIPFDFAYYRPETIDEAVNVYQELEKAGNHPVYYGGGSELISMARVGNSVFDAAIDLKCIPECCEMGFRDQSLVLGSTLTLSKIGEADYFPLLAKTAGRIADHTMQCKITLGGNLMSTIFYRETALPLLLVDAAVLVAGTNGRRKANINDMFDKRLNLKQGEFIVSFLIEKPFLDAPYFHIKKTKNEKIDYPLVTVAGLNHNGKLRIAFSGLCPYPFRNLDVEDILNKNELNAEQRADKITKALSATIFSDTNGSSGYRSYVLKNTLQNILEYEGM